MCISFSLNTFLFKNIRKLINAIGNKFLMLQSLKIIYSKIFPQYVNELEKAVRGCKSLLDAGCGSDSPIKSFSKKLYCIGVDIFKPSIEKSKI